MSALAGLALLAAPAALLAAPASARAAAPRRARLQGRFSMAGVVTDARNVKGVHVGDRVTRTWTFTPGCATGACRTVLLVRVRGRASDRVTLHRKRAAYYTGNGSFYAPLRCGGRDYPKGELVPFRITVKLTAAAVSAGTVVATRLKATFTNRSRQNKTPCVVAPSHDAAKYKGRLV